MQAIKVLPPAVGTLTQILITRHPLLIQKTMADKLSDKIQVIIAPPSTGGGFIGAALLGGNRREANAAGAAAEEHAAKDEQ